MIERHRKQRRRLQRRLRRKRRLNRISIFFLIVAIILFIIGNLTACTTPGTYPVQTAPNSAADAVATADHLVAIETSEANLATATAAHATSIAFNATGTAVTQATGTGEAIKATGTAQTMEVFTALEVEQTRASIDLTRDNATSQAAFFADREAAAVEVLEIENQDYQRALQIQRDREEAAVKRQQALTAAMPYLYASGIIVLFFILLIIYLVIDRRLNPKVVTPYPSPDEAGQGQPLIAAPRMPLLITDGLSGVLHIPAAGRTIEADPALQMPSTAPINLADHGRFEPGHYLIAGETRSGKGTLGRFILQSMNVNIIAVDPHYEAGNWGNVDKVIGGARRFDQIRAFFEGYMVDELNRRAEEKFNDPTATWPSVLVIIDEAPAIKANLGKVSSLTWGAWVREGWKYNLFIMLITQSTRVETLGIKGEKDVLKNFVYRFALGEVALDEYPGVADHLERPAVIIGKREARPVVIPNITAESLRNSQPQNGLTTPNFTAPEPIARGLTTAKGHVSQAEVDKILALYHNGESLRTIEREVWGTEKGKEGGANFYKIKDVIGRGIATASTVTISQPAR